MDNTFIRGDYKELCKLVVIFLGGNVPDFRFQIPGACHHSRFMSKCIYYLKMKLLLNQTNMFHRKEITEIHIMSEFVGFFYSRWWFQSPICSSAPAQDIQSILSMRKYSQFNPSVAQSCLKSMKKHHEYLTEELVVVSLADENLA